MKQFKQCTIQFIEDDSLTTIWIDIKDAIVDKEINVDYKMFNIRGKAKVITVFHGKVTDEK